MDFKNIWAPAILLLSIACNSNKNEAKNLETPNVKLVNKYFDLFNRHQWKEMADMYSDSAEFKDPSLGKEKIIQSKFQIEKKYAELHSVFPNIKDEIIQIYPTTNDSIVVVEFISTGTAADGSNFRLPICTIFTFDNGKIIRDYSYYDNF